MMMMMMAEAVLTKFSIMTLVYRIHFIAATTNSTESSYHN